MDTRGEPATAAVFRDMAEIERRHVEMVAQLATTLRQAVPPAERFTWLLPPEVAESWDEVQHSALLTPYRALAIAVVNEERTFALYSYVSAHSGDTVVARQAEALAREELSHATELRVRRRLAWRRESPASGHNLADGIESLAAFHTVDAHLQRTAADTHRAIAAALAAAGDAESARLVAELAAREEEAAAPASGTPTRRPQSTAPASLLQQALHPLEAASEVYEDLVAQASDEELLRAAQTALHSVVEAISAIGQRLSQLSAGGDGARS
jgi:rubrerythrin